MKDNMLKKKIIPAIVVVILIVIGIRFFGQKKPVQQVKKAVPNVKVQKVALGSISSVVQYSGKLEANQVIVVTPKTSGKIATSNVNIGDRVKAGQVLFTLDTTDLNAQLQEQQASLDAANANLAKTNGTSISQAVQTAQQQITKDQIAYNKDQINYNTANDNYNKTLQLYNAGAVAQQNLINDKQTLDTATQQLNSDSAQLKADQDNLNLQEGQLGPQAVQYANSQVEQSQAAVNYAQTQISDSTITSPIDGVVSAETVDIGSVTSATEGTVTVIDPTKLTVQINVPDNAVAKLKVGQSVPVTVGEAGDKSITGVINTISPDSDPKTNTYLVKVQIDNTNGDLQAGTFASISLPDKEKDNILTVPNESITVENSIDFIYTVNNNKIKKVQVNLGIANDKVTEVTGNVKEGAEIITEGQNLLNEGEAVKVVK